MNAFRLLQGFEVAPRDNVFFSGVDCIKLVELFPVVDAAGELGQDLPYYYDGRVSGRKVLGQVVATGAFGVDVSEGMVRLARERHPGLRFEHAPGETVKLGETFDFIVLSDVVPYVEDLLALFENAARHTARDTRIVIHSYSQLWRPAFRLLELLRLKTKTPVVNWVSQADVESLLRDRDVLGHRAARRRVRSARDLGLRECARRGAERNGGQRCCPAARSR